MGNEVRLGYMIWHSTFRLVFSIRGLIALLFSAYMMIMVAVIYDKLPETFFELIRVFTNDPELQFHWLFFDNAISKAVTIFVAPILIFDAVSGDRSDDRFGLILSRPITRTQYLLTKLISTFLAFGLVFMPVMALGYPAFDSILDTISPVSYFGTSLLLYLLAFFTLCVGLLISTLTKNSLVSFLVILGLMSFIMLPNASKYSSEAMEDAAMATPHYYATYFTSHAMDGLTYIVFAIVIMLFSLPILFFTIWKFKKESL